MTYISKTDYVLWRACPKNAWLRIHKPELYYSTELTEYEQSVIDMGVEVERVGTYNPLGEPSVATFGNGITRAFTYDNRGRLTGITDGPSGSPVYSLAVGYTNGRVSSANDSVNGNWSSFTYDSFSRLQSSWCSSHCPDGTNAEGYNYTYDEYGNRWTQTLASGSGSGPNHPTTSISTTTSRPPIAPVDRATSVTTERATWNMMDRAATGHTTRKATCSSTRLLQKRTAIPTMARASEWNER
jgi:YD repeat-containing protein